jgi:CheY-like chemotaxis protein
MQIRTPMNGIFGMLSLLKDTPMSPQGTAYLDTCMRSAESLLAVLNDVLLFSKAEANSIVLEQAPFNLNTVVEDVLQLAAANVSLAHNIDLVSFVQLDVPLLLIGDASRLRQVLSNLVNNAVKFTKHGEVSLEVSLGSLSPPAVELVFEVSDTGIGISPADQERLFRPFSQADSSITRQYGGTGLGLAICDQLVTLFGGHITVKSKLARGSTFTFTAKFKLDQSFTGHGCFLSRDLELASPAVESLRGVKILVVDDNATNCLMLEATLNHFQADVLTCRSGAEALEMLSVEALKKTPVQLVLLDYHMPRMSGIDVAKAMMAAGLETKIILLSSHIDKNVPLESNIAAFTAKPIRRASLIHMICSILSRGTLQAPTLEAAPFAAPDLCSQRSILVAEDNVINRQVLVELLKQSRCEVIEAANGAEALRLFNDQVQAVLMDVHMPVMDGIETTYALPLL